MKQAILAAFVVAATVFGITTAAMAQTESTCTRPDSPARVLTVARPEFPTDAMMSGTTGTVQVRIELDEQSKIVGKPIAISGPFELRAASIVSAKNSTFQTQIVNCVPVKSTYRFAVSFSNR